MRGIVLALDLATRTGFAVGAAGERPRTGVVRLKAPSEHRSIAFANLIAWLADEITRSRPGLIVKESPLPLQAFADRGNSEAAVMMTYGLHGVAEGIAARFGVNITDAHPATVRKHLIGKGRIGDRAAMKQAVIDRCRLLKLIPADCTDDNQADAAAIFDWSCATYCNRSVSTEKLHLFGERAP